VNKPVTSPAVQKKYDALVDELVKTADVKAGKMFGMPSLFSKGKSVAGLYGDDMVFKLAPAALEEALALKGAQLFDPSGMGRPMKAWAQVPARHARRWAELARQALGDGG
jgi:hypothetical protein